MEIPNCFYRVSIKALILNETKDKFLITQEEDGTWELPGGGLDWGMSPQEDLPREIQEEMGLEVVSIADHPSYFTVYEKTNYTGSGAWVANVLYETTLKDLDFTPSDECVAVRFVNAEDIKDMDVFPNITILAEQFDPNRHR